MIPDNMLEELSLARSYGTIEDIGREKTDVDQSDGDDDFYNLCLEVARFSGSPSSRMEKSKKGEEK